MKILFGNYFVVLFYLRLRVSDERNVFWEEGNSEELEDRVVRLHNVFWERSQKTFP